MGFDYQATENGEFKLIITEYGTGDILDEIHLTGLKPFQRLNREVIIGER